MFEQIDGVTPSRHHAARSCLRWMLRQSKQSESYLNVRRHCTVFDVVLTFAFVLARSPRGVHVDYLSLIQ